MAMFTGASYVDRRLLFAPAQHPAAAGTVTPDLSQGCIWQIFMPAGNITIANPINMVIGDMLIFAIIQDSVGARLVTWGNNFFRATGLTLTITASATDSVTFVFAPQGFWGQIGSALNLINT